MRYAVVTSLFFVSLIAFCMLSYWVGYARSEKIVRALISINGSISNVEKTKEMINKIVSQEDVNELEIRVFPIVQNALSEINITIFDSKKIEDDVESARRWLKNVSSNNSKGNIYFNYCIIYQAQSASDVSVMLNDIGVSKKVTRGDGKIFITIFRSPKPEQELYKIIGDKAGLTVFEIDPRKGDG